MVRLEKVHFRKAAREKWVEDYWFLDFLSQEPAPRWVRMTFLEWTQVLRVLDNVQQSQGGHRIHSQFDSEGPYYGEKYEDVDWASVRIHSERELDKLVDENGKTKPYDLADCDFDGVCTKREYLFGSDYQQTADEVRSGKLDPSDLYDDWKTEPLRDYDDVKDGIYQEVLDNYGIDLWAADDAQDEAA
jgi:hypothetical protein